MSVGFSFQISYVQTAAGLLSLSFRVKCEAFGALVRRALPPERDRTVTLVSEKPPMQL